MVALALHACFQLPARPIHSIATPDLRGASNLSGLQRSGIAYKCHSPSTCHSLETGKVHFIKETWPSQARGAPLQDTTPYMRLEDPLKLPPCHPDDGEEDFFEIIDRIAPHDSLGDHTSCTDKSSKPSTESQPITRVKTTLDREYPSDKLMLQQMFDHNTLNPDGLIVVEGSEKFLPHEPPTPHYAYPRLLSNEFVQPLKDFKCIPDLLKVLLDVVVSELSSSYFIVR